MSIGDSMQQGLSTAGLYTDMAGLAKLRAKASSESPEANREVARQFEALFVQTMLKAMRQASQLSDAVDGEQTRFYQDMYDKQIALDLAGNGGIGLAAIIERQLGGSTVGNTTVGTTQIRGPVAMPAATEPAEIAARRWEPPSQEAFIRELWPHAAASAKELGVAADVLIAQAALETGWGKKMIHDQQGGNAFNLFGIKAGNSWQGERVSVSTVEYRDGIAQRERASFRAYASLQESMNDYVAFLTQNPRYQRALEKAGDSAAFLQELQKAGYATDPSYADKIGNIMMRDSFSNTVSALRMPDDGNTTRAG